MAALSWIWSWTTPRLHPLPQSIRSTKILMAKSALVQASNRPSAGRRKRSRSRSKGRGGGPPTRLLARRRPRALPQARPRLQARARLLSSPSRSMRTVKALPARGRAHAAEHGSPRARAGAEDTKAAVKPGETRKGSDGGSTSRRTRTPLAPWTRMRKMLRLRGPTRPLWGENIVPARATINPRHLCGGSATSFEWLEERWC